MKQYYSLLALLFVVAFVVGISNRQATTHVAERVLDPTRMPNPKATAVYEWGEQQAEPFLYAVPLGYFTPSADASVFEWPGALAPVVGSLTAGERHGFTSEYHSAEGETWLCVQWTVDEEIMGWRCDGWTPASMGMVEREREYQHEQDEAKEQNA